MSIIFCHFVIEFSIRGAGVVIFVEVLRNLDHVPLFLVTSLAGQSSQSPFPTSKVCFLILLIHCGGQSGKFCFGSFSPFLKRLLRHLSKKAYSYISLATMCFGLYSA